MTDREKFLEVVKKVIKNEEVQTSFMYLCKAMQIKTDLIDLHCKKIVIELDILLPKNLNIDTFYDSLECVVNDNPVDRKFDQLTSKSVNGMTVAHVMKLLKLIVLGVASMEFFGLNAVKNKEQKYMNESKKQIVNDPNFVMDCILEYLNNKKA